MFVSKVLRTVPVFFIALFVIFIGTASAKDSFSTRANLKSLANKYFDALAANDPSLMPFSPDVKYTENGVETKVGNGLWKTAGKVLMTRHLIDTYNCGTHTQAVIEEKNKEGKFRPILMGVRLQYENEKITEIESIIAREKEFAMKHTPRGGAIAVLETKDQDWEGILPIEERSSRLAMIAAADDYFDMFTRKPIYGTPFAKPCHRWENGYMTTKGGFFEGKEYIPGDCSPKGLVIKHKPRRIPLVDVEAGVVVAYVHFVTLPDFHMFKMRNGKVELIQAVIGHASESMGWAIEPICKE
ncbi:MAG: hypothetical protein GX654_00420 [Desulfatiglans sp.]|jgi:hypothetical protein|nr:hypothetical protein [Desulfatiglans sp.]